MKLKIIKYIFVYIAFIISFVILLTLASSFSSEKISCNVKESAKVFLAEGNYKMIYIPYKNMKLRFNNYTDSLMINTIYSIDSSRPMNSALLARKNYIPGVTTEVFEDSTGELKSSSKYEYHNEVGELNDLVNGEKSESFEYARYWHGWLVFLRPLLLIFNLSEIRIIFTILLIVLAITLLYLLGKHTNIFISIIFLVSLISIEYFYLGFSLEDIFVFFITIISSIILLIRFKKIKEIGMFFFVIGIITNFLDFLTVPIVTLAIPLIIYLLLKQKENNHTFKQEVLIIAKSSILWFIGYALTWGTKWIIVDLFFDKNLIYTALNQVFYRSVSTKEISFVDVILANVKQMSNLLIIFIFFLSVLCNLKIYLNFNKINMKKNIETKKINPFLLILPMPFLWYAILKNHSFYHFFFTYRNIIIIFICLGICVDKVVEGFIEKNNL